MGFTIPACAPKKITVNTRPADTSVRLDGQSRGSAPTTMSLNFRDKDSFIVGARREGFFPEDRVLFRSSPEVKEGLVELVLIEDPSWAATTLSKATNQWVRIEINPTLTFDEVWQKLVDSITDRFSHIEQMDLKSGYVRTIHRVRRFQGKEQQFAVRTSFVGSIAQRDPLIYKLRIEAEFSAGEGTWLTYDRIFKEDAQLVVELESRLGAQTEGALASPTEALEEERSDDPL